MRDNAAALFKDRCAYLNKHISAGFGNTKKHFNSSVKQSTTMN